ncbi:MAG: SBBP repeat-containing protein [Promethearchaeota archaeon]
MKKRINSLLIFIITFLCVSIVLNMTEDTRNNGYIDKNCVDEFFDLKTSSTTMSCEWNLTWGGADFNEYASAIAIDTMGNIYITGIRSLGVEQSLLLVKFNNSGDHEWDNVLGDFNWGGSDVVVDSKNNLYVLGNNHSSMYSTITYLIKYNSDGIMQWNRSYSSGGHDLGNGLTIDANDNIYIVGYTDHGHYDYDVLLVKYNSLGEQLWNNSWGGIGTQEGESVELDSLNNVYVTGHNGSGDTNNDIILIKFDNTGTFQWNFTWSNDYFERGMDLALDSLDNIYVSGRTGSLIPDTQNMVLIKFNNSGQQLWNRTWGGSGQDYGTSIEIDSSDNVIIGGNTYSFGLGQADTALVCYNNVGVQLWNYTWGGTGYDYSTSIEIDSSNNLFNTGRTGSFGLTSYDLFIIKYNLIQVVTDGGKIPFGQYYSIFLIISVISLIIVQKRKLRKIFQ